MGNFFSIMIILLSFLLVTISNLNEIFITYWADDKFNKVTNFFFST